MRRTVAVSASLALAVFAWYLVADRVTPYTSNARVKAIVIDVTPEVSGYVAAVAVSNGQIVERGDLLARIDPRPFQLDVDRARADLQLATQDVGAGSASVEVALAAVAAARSSLANTQAQSARTFDLEAKGIVTRAAGDNARALLDAAQSKLVATEADLERARRQLGETGAQNAQILEAVATLGEAELALERTELRAPARGVIADLTIAEGVFASAGAPLISFVSFDEVWVEAYMTENNIARIQIGAPAEIGLDLYPGRTFDGIVASLTLAASDGTSSGGLPSAPRVDGWMRDPQRFPVRIAMPGYEAGREGADIRRMVNGQADVIVYTGGNPVLNALGAGWMRFMGLLSYAY